MAGATDLYDVAVEYLNACATALADTPDGCPPCVYVSPGPPPWDIVPSLIVHVGGPTLADTSPQNPVLAPMHRTQSYGELHLVTLTALIIRCAPVLDNDADFPFDLMKSVSKQVNADLWAVWNHIRAGKRNGTLFAPKEREFAIDPAVSLNQEGGACGWQVTVRTQLDGYAIAP